MCLEDEDSRGFTWETTQAGNILTEPCNDGFTGITFSCMDFADVLQSSVNILCRSLTFITVVYM